MSNLGEAAGYALGLIKAGIYDQAFVEILINASRNNLHDRIARSMMMNLSLIHFLNSS